LNREVKFSPRCGRNIDTSLASIDIVLGPNLGDVRKETSHPLKERDVGHKLKRIVTKKLMKRIKRAHTDGWRLIDEEFDELIRTYNFT
jgi:hypothetical protein